MASQTPVQRYQKYIEGQKAAGNYKDILERKKESMKKKLRAKRHSQQLTNDETAINFGQFTDCESLCKSGQSEIRLMQKKVERTIINFMR